MSFEDSKIEDSTMREDEEEDDDDDYDDDEFMANVNVYLNTREESPSNNKVLEGILRRSSSVRTKTVKFEDEFNDLQSDTSRSRQELLDQISRMTDMLRDAEAQVSLEREKRRKKDKYLLKLAKELKKRNAQQEVDKVRMEELEEKRQYLEHHWVLAGKELDQEKMLRQKIEKEQESGFERALKSEKEKCDTLRRNHEKQLETMKAGHAKQCDELGRAILKATLEADRLHNQLIGSPRSTKMFSNRNSWRDVTIVVLLFSGIVAIFALFAFNVGFFTMEGACAPVMPGRTLSRANAGQSFQAPWWVPAPYKERTFQRICGDPSKSHLSLQWLPDGQDQKILLTQGSKVALKRNGLVKAEIYGDHIRTWSKKGLSEDHGSLWYP